MSVATWTENGSKLIVYSGPVEYMGYACEHEDGTYYFTEKAYEINEHLLSHLDGHS